MALVEEEKKVEEVKGGELLFCGTTAWDAISESWLREYQVLPSRTHPHMQMSSSGGYLLTGIRITASEQKPRLVI